MVRALNLIAGIVMMITMAFAASAQTPSSSSASAAPANASELRVEAEPLAPGSEPMISSANDRDDLHLRLSVNAPGFVIDRRDLALLSGRNTVVFTDLAATLQPASLYWQALNLPELQRLTRLPSNNEHASTRWQALMFVEQGGNRSVTLSYRAQGLPWQSDYQLQLDTNAGTAQLIEGVSVHNQTGVDLSGADITLVNRHGHERDLDTTRQWPTGSTLRGMTQPPQSLAFEAALLSTSRADMPQSAAQLAPVQQHITLIADADDALGFASGPIEVVRISPNGEREALGQTALNPHQARPDLAIAVGTSTAVEVEREQADYRHTDQGIAIAWRLRLRNISDGEQTLILKERIDGSWQLEQGAEDWQRTPTGLRRSVTLAAGEEREVGYRILRQ